MGKNESGHLAPPEMTKSLPSSYCSSWSSELAWPPRRGSHLTTSRPERWEQSYQGAAGAQEESFGLEKPASRREVQTHIIWGLAALGARATEWSRTVSTTWATPASPFSHSPT